jgi:ribosomal protein S18 acetylase RimI-like enzyme
MRPLCPPMKAPEISIRRIQPGDSNHLRSMHIALAESAAGADGGDGHHPQNVPLEAWRSTAAIGSFAPGKAIYIAWNGGMAAGFMQMVCDTEADEVKITHLWVRPEFRRQGVGRDLLTAAMDFVAEAPSLLAKVSLWVTAEDQAAVQFCTRHGFQSTGKSAPLRGDTRRHQDEYVRATRTQYETADRMTS